MIRQLIGHSAAYTVANLLSRGTILAWLIVLPHFVRTDDYGALGLVMTVAAFVNVLFPLEVGQAVARYFSTAPVEEQPAWASTAWTFSLAMMTAGCLLAFVLAPWLTSLIFQSDRYVPVFRLALPYFILSASFLFLQSQFRWAFRTRDYAFVTAVFAIVTLALSIGLAASLADPLWGVLLGLVIGAAAGVALGLFQLRDTVGLMIDRAKLVKMLRFSLPLVPASLSVLVSTYANRFILNDLLTLKDVGLFTWASQLANVPATLLLGVQAAVTPLVMRYHAEPETPRRLARSFETVITAILCVAIGLALLTPEFIRILGYTAYAGAAPLVMLLGPAYLLLQLYVFFPGFAVAERTSHQLWVSLIAAASTLVLNYVLIGRLRLVGAAVATLVCSMIFLGLWVWLSNRHYRVPVHWGKLAIFCGIAAAIAFGGEHLQGGLLLTVAIKIALVGALGATAVVFGFIDVRVLGSMIAARRRLADAAA